MPPSKRCNATCSKKPSSSAFGAPILRSGASSRATETDNPVGFSETSWSRNFLFAGDHRSFLPTRLLIGSAGRTHVSSVGVDEDAGRWLLLHLGYNACARTHDSIHPWTVDT